MRCCPSWTSSGGDPGFRVMLLYDSQQLLTIVTLRWNFCFALGCCFQCLLPVSVAACNSALQLCFPKQFLHTCTSWGDSHCASTPRLFPVIASNVCFHILFNVYLLKLCSRLASGLCAGLPLVVASQACFQTEFQC